jgi:alanine racemase
MAQQTMRLLFIALVATLGLGYGDGYPRHLSGSDAAVLLQGRRCPLLGRVTMDQIMIDVTDLPETVRPGDEVVLLGGQGGEQIDTRELARQAGTIPWEILTGISRRVARVYHSSH